MKRITTLFVLVMLATPAFGQQEGALTEDLMQSLRSSVTMDAPTKAMMNAITKNDVRSLALDHQVAISNDMHFTNKIATQGVTDQQKSGRCWLFAGLNILRPVASETTKEKAFEFSQTYLFFYDKLEKSNLFLESIIATREKPVEDREVQWLLKHPFADGGQWNMVLALVEKYGVVPADIMPETTSSSNTGRLNQLMSAKLVRDAYLLRSKSESGASEATLRAEKERMLTEVYRMLVLHIGMPPQQFTWRYDDENGKASDPVTYTPKEFYNEFVKVKLADYVCLHSVPVHPFGKAYQVQFDRNLVDSPNMTFVNVDIQTMKEYTLKSVLGGDPVWFGCDVGKESDSKLGVMRRGLYDYESIYGMEFDMPKKERILYGQSIPSHAMVFTGVDLIDGKPQKWLVENSWGTDVGEKGMFSMYDSWYDEYMFSVIIHKKYLPEATLALYQGGDAEVLPPWDPLFAVEPR